MKRRFLIAAAALMIAVLVLAGLGWRAWTRGPQGVDPAGPPLILSVAPGTTLRQVAYDLQERGALAQPRVFLLGARWLGHDRRLMAGRYAVPAGASPRDLLEALFSGRPLPIAITLPEGQPARVLATVLADSLGLDPAAILAAADALVMAGAETLMHPPERSRFAALLAEGTASPGVQPHWSEGYFAPDTYHFASFTSAEAVARTVVGLQLQRVSRARATALPPAAGLSTHGLLTLAAIVETEARRADERARVAAVYHNRLARGMRLEADPTVAYWLGKRGERLLYRDLDVDSPYNTYRRSGLPIGPIGNPGEAALLAAAQPDTSSRDLFFVADGDGGHVFSETHAEHERAVARYRALMRERRR